MLRRYLLITITFFFCSSAANISDQKPTVQPSPQKVNSQPTPPRQPTSRNQKTFFGFNDQKTTLWCERLNASASAALAATMGAGAAQLPALRRVLEFTKNAPGKHRAWKDCAIAKCEYNLLLNETQLANLQVAEESARLTRESARLVQESARLAQQNVHQAVQAQTPVAIVQPPSASHVEQAQLANNRTVQAQAAVGIVQPVDTPIIRKNSREIKMPSKEQKAKEAITATGSPNGGPKKDDKDPRGGATKIASTIGLLGTLSDESFERAFTLATVENSLEHFFKAKHNFGPLLEKLVTKENVVHEVLKAAEGKLPIDGLFIDIPVCVHGFTVYIRGIILDGIPRLATMFIK